MEHIQEAMELVEHRMNWTKQLQEKVAGLIDEDEGFIGFLEKSGRFVDTYEYQELDSITLAFRNQKDPSTLHYFLREYLSSKKYQ